MANRITVTDGVNLLLDYFKENESEISRKELQKKDFFPNKKDLNMVLYAMNEKMFLQQTQAKPPVWKKRTDSVLTEELKKEIHDHVRRKLSNRRSEGDIQIFAENVQIGNHNIMAIKDTEALCQQFSNIQLK